MITITTIIQLDTHTYTHINYVYVYVYTNYVRIEEAATRIQAVFRGHKVRASMKQGDSSANSNNTKTGTTAEPEPTEEELKAEFREDDKGK